MYKAINVHNQAIYCKFVPWSEWPPVHNKKGEMREKRKDKKQ